MLFLPVISIYDFFFFFSSRRRHTRWTGDWSSDVCSSDLPTRDRSIDAHELLLIELDLARRLEDGGARAGLRLDDPDGTLGGGGRTRGGGGLRGLGILAPGRQGAHQGHDEDDAHLTAPGVRP